MIQQSPTNELTLCATLINASIGNVFEGLHRVSAHVTSIWEQSCPEMERPTMRHLKTIGPIVRDILNSQSLKIHGAGAVFAPGELADRQLHQEWWCRTPREEIQRLTLNFNSRSDRFYDYPHMSWFTRPQQTRQASIEGPFVDLYGTELYIVAFSVPIFYKDRFIGVAAADVSLHSLEPLLVRSLMNVSNEALLLNAEGRILAANSSAWVTGDLMKPVCSLGSSGAEVNLIEISSNWRVVEISVPRGH